MDIDKNTLEKMIKEILAEKLSGQGKSSHGVIKVNVPKIKVCECDRMDTGDCNDVVYTKDLFTLAQSPRLGCGIMEMNDTTFKWKLNYDEIDYVIEGRLNILINGETVSAERGEIILIPKGSEIKFSVPNYARFMYVTYPADWSEQ